MSTPQEDAGEVRVVKLIRPSSPLYQRLGDGPMIEVLMKAVHEDLEPSEQKAGTGRKLHPFNMQAAIDFKIHNPHHSTCIETKKEACVGLGFQSDKVFDQLDQFCEISFSDVMGDVAEDFFSTGNGYIEVVRNETGQIRGLYHIRAKSVFVYIEDEAMNRHYEVIGNGTDGFVGSKHFAAFGDLDRFKTTNFAKDAKRTSEVIHFRRPTALSRWYGFPDWIAATASIELLQALTQHQFDFFLNRGVPEFILTVTGTKKVSKEDWTKIEEAMKAQIGLGKSHKSIALNLVGEDMKVQIDKLALENQADAQHFSTMADTLAMHVVSAHRVPPLLAGILIPGKLGAANEMSNALIAFQALVMGPAQRNFSNVLALTLGNTTFNQGVSLTDKDFKGEKGNGFRTILDEMSDGMGLMAEADTMARMREPMADAAAQGRDLSQGTLQQRRTASPSVVARPRTKAATEEQIGELLGRMFSAALEKMTA